MNITSISKGPALLYMEKTLQKKSWQHHTIDFKVNLMHRLMLPTLLYSAPCCNGNPLLINPSFLQALLFTTHAVNCQAQVEQSLSTQ